LQRFVCRSPRQLRKRRRFRNARRSGLFAPFVQQDFNRHLFSQALQNFFDVSFESWRNHQFNHRLLRVPCPNNGHTFARFHDELEVGNILTAKPKIPGVSVHTFQKISSALRVRSSEFHIGKKIRCQLSAFSFLRFPLYPLFFLLSPLLYALCPLRFALYPAPYALYPYIFVLLTSLPVTSPTNMTSLIDPSTG